MWWVIIDPPYWIKNKKATINPINKIFSICCNSCLILCRNKKRPTKGKYCVEIKKDPQRVTKIKSFINKYNLEGISFLLEKEKNIVTIALNVLYGKKNPAYVSKNN